MIQYRTGGFGSNLIEPVEIVKETEKQLVVVETWNGKRHENRTNKSSNYHQYHKTWEEAKEFLLEKAERNVESLRLQLEQAKGRLGNIKGLKQN